MTFIIDVLVRYIVGRRVPSSMETTFVLDILEQTLWVRRPSGVVHHSGRGSQYVSLAYTQQPEEAGLLASTGSTGDSHDNTVTESINDLYKAEVIYHKSWKNRKRRPSTVWQVLKLLREQWTPDMMDTIHEVINRST